MSVAELDELTAVLGRVKTWSQAGRIALLKGVVETLAPEGPSPQPAPRGRPVDEIRELFRTDRPAPDDDTVKRWIDEYRTEKYG